LAAIHIPWVASGDLEKFVANLLNQLLVGFALLLGVTGSSDWAGARPARTIARQIGKKAREDFIAILREMVPAVNGKPQEGNDCERRIVAALPNLKHFLIQLQ